MRILFVSRWYHPNHHPIVKSFQQEGHEVKFISLAEREAKNYNALEPKVIGYSVFKRPIERIKTIFGDDSESHPPKLGSLYKEITEFEPNVVVIRNYEIYSILSFIISKIKGYNTMFHEQMEMCRPDYSWKKYIINDIHQRVFRNGLIRITPIKGDCSRYDSIPNVNYFPFVIDPELQRDFEDKEFFHGENINIIMVGRLWRKRKNHTHLLEVVDRLRDEYDIRVTLVGALPEEKSDKRIRNFINDRGIEDVVEIKANVPFEELQNLYFKHDLFVLPSHSEPAAVSLLEAMAHGLPVISSDENGTRWYIKEGVNGYVFETGNIDDLEEKVRSIIEDDEELIRMGKSSYNIANHNHHPDVYRERFVDLVNTVF